MSMSRVWTWPGPLVGQARPSEALEGRHEAGSAISYATPLLQQLVAVRLHQTPVVHGAPHGGATPT